MKNILRFSLILASLTLFSGSADAKTYGKFEVGQTFSMKVVKVKSTRQTGLGGTPVKSKIHSKVPRLRKGKVVHFRIKARGRLTAKKISIPFAHSSRNMNEYNLFRDGTIAITRNAEITRRGKKPVRANLNFFITDNSGMEPVYYTVIYKLK